MDLFASGNVGWSKEVDSCQEKDEKLQLALAEVRLWFRLSSARYPSDQKLGLSLNKADRQLLSMQQALTS